MYSKNHHNKVIILQLKKLTLQNSVLLIFTSIMVKAALRVKPGVPSWYPCPV